MAVSYPTQTPASDGAAGITTSLIEPFTKPAGSSQLVVVQVSNHILGNFGAGTPPSGVTFDGDALTDVGDAAGASFDGHVSIWRRAVGSPSEVTGNVVVSFTGTRCVEFGAFVLDGVHQTTPERAAADVVVNDSGSATASITIAAGDSHADDIAVAAFGAGNALSSPTQTQIWVQNVSTEFSSGNGAGDRAAGSASAITFERAVAGSDIWRAVAVSFQPAAAAGGGTNTLPPKAMHMRRMAG